MSDQALARMQDARGRGARCAHDQLVVAEYVTEDVGGV